MTLVLYSPLTIFLQTSAMFSIRSFAITIAVLSAVVLAQALYMKRAIEQEERAAIPGMCQGCFSL